MNKINSFCSVVSAVNWLGPHSQPLLKRAIISCFKKNGIFQGLQNFPIFSQVFDEIDEAAKQLKLEGYEHRNVRDNVKFILQSFIETGGILNCSRGITIADFISKEDLILTVKEESSSYVIRTLTGMICKDLQRYYETEPLHPARMRTLIVVDETSRTFSGLVSKDGYHDPNEPMKSFVRTRRWTGIGIIALTQEPESAPSWLTENSAFVLGFPIGGKAREYLEQLLNVTKEQGAYIDELPQYTAIFRDRRFSRRYLVQIPGDLKVEPITVEETADVMRPFWNRLRAQFETEEIVRGEPTDLDKIEKLANNQKIGVMILRVLKEKPFLNKTGIMDQLHGRDRIPKKLVGLALDWLGEQGLVTSTKARSKTRDAEYYPLTRSAQEALKIPEAQRIAPSRFKHTLYLNLVADRLEEKGYEVYKEYGGDLVQGRLEGRMDILAIKDGRRIAYEITLSFSNLTDNIFKCLEVFGADELHIVAETQEAVEKAMKSVSDRVRAHLLEKVTWETLTVFF